MVNMKDIFLSYLLVGFISSLVIAIVSIFSSRLINRYGARWLGRLCVLLAFIMLIPVSLFAKPIPLPRFSIPVDELRSHLHAPAVDYSITVQKTDLTHENTENTYRVNTAPKVCTESSIDARPEAFDKKDYRVIYPSTSQLVSNTQANYPSWYKNPTLLLYIWLSGILLIIAYQVVHYTTWRAMIMRTSKPVTDRDVLLSLNIAQNSTGYLNFIPIYQSNRVNTPMTAGVLRPIILLPNLPYNIENLNLILTHELTHLKRRDHWRKLLFMLASAVHWYNPFAWLMRAKTHRILELACDETMVAGKPSVYRQRYGETLLSEIKRSNGPKKLLVNCFINEKKNVMKRMQIIIRQRSHKRGLALLSILVIVCITGSSLFGCESTSESISKTYGSLTIYYYQDWQDLVSQSMVDRAITLYKKNNPGAEIEIYDPSGGDPNRVSR